MLIVCRTKAPRRELTVIGSQYQRARRVEMPVKMGCSRRSASPWLVLPGMRSAVETESAVRKCSLAVIGEVSALASRNQVSVSPYPLAPALACAIRAAITSAASSIKSAWLRPLRRVGVQS